MSQYIDESTSGTQLLPTSRAAFICVTATGWLVTAGGLVSIILEFDSLDELDFNRLWLAIPTVMFAVLGAASGAIIALLIGATLSRQFCWIFSLVAGALSIPVMIWSFVRTTEVLSPPMSNAIFRFVLQSRALSIWMLPMAMIFAIIAGIVLGVMLTRRRLGFGDRSRRAARIVLLCSACIVGLIEVLWAIAQHANVTHLTVSNSGDWMMLGITVLVATAIAALIKAERRVAPGGRFEVLPVQVIQPARQESD